MTREKDTDTNTLKTELLRDKYKLQNSTHCTYGILDKVNLFTQFLFGFSASGFGCLFNLASFFFWTPKMKTIFFCTKVV